MNRLKDLDLATGIAISFVVFGHLLVPEFSKFNDYVAIRNLIYGFHMPLFMFFSGFLMAYTYKPVSETKSYVLFLKKKILKFLPPYILFSFLFIFAENTFGNGEWKSFSQDIFDVFLRPPKSPAGFLWYIYLLFEFYISVPLLLKLLKNNYLILLIFALIIHIIPSFTELFSLNLYGFFLLFISLGFIAVKFLSAYYKLILSFGYLFIIVFIVVLVTDYFYNVPKTIMGICSIPAIHYIAKRFENYLPVWLQSLGQHSFYIYLMNTFIIGIFAVILFRFLSVTPSIPWMIFLFISGLIFPVFIYRYIIKKISWLNKLIR